MFAVEAVRVGERRRTLEEIIPWLQKLLILPVNQFHRSLLRDLEVKLLASSTLSFYKLGKTGLITARASSLTSSTKDVSFHRGQ